MLYLASATAIFLIRFFFIGIISAGRTKDADWQSNTTAGPVCRNTRTNLARHHNKLASSASLARRHGMLYLASATAIFLIRFFHWNYLGVQQCQRTCRGDTATSRQRVVTALVTTRHQDASGTAGYASRCFLQSPDEHTADTSTPLQLAGSAQFRGQQHQPFCFGCRQPRL